MSTLPASLPAPDSVHPSSIISASRPASESVHSSLLGSMADCWRGRFIHVRTALHNLPFCLKHKHKVCKDEIESGTFVILLHPDILLTLTRVPGAFLARTRVFPFTWFIPISYVFVTNSAHFKIIVKIFQRGIGKNR